MKNSLKQNIIKKISKILKLKTCKQLSKIKRSQYDVWDSLVDLHILFTMHFAKFLIILDYGFDS